VSEAKPLSGAALVFWCWFCRELCLSAEGLQNHTDHRTVPNTAHLRLPFLQQADLLQLTIDTEQLLTEEKSHIKLAERSQTLIKSVLAFLFTA